MGTSGGHYAHRVFPHAGVGPGRYSQEDHDVKDYELCRKYDASPRHKTNWDKEPLKSDPHNQGLKRLYPCGVKLPINLGLNGVMDAVGGAIQKVWHGEAKVDAALAEAEKLANQAIADAAKQEPFCSRTRHCFTWPFLQRVRHVFDP